MIASDVILGGDPAATVPQNGGAFPILYGDNGAGTRLVVSTCESDHTGPGNAGSKSTRLAPGCSYHLGKILQGNNRRLDAPEINLRASKRSR